MSSVYLLDMGKTVTYIVILRIRYNKDINRNIRLATINLSSKNFPYAHFLFRCLSNKNSYLCLWNITSKIQTFVTTIICTSLTVRAQSSGLTLSSTMSGRGPYLSRSGTLCWFYVCIPNQMTGNNKRNKKNRKNIIRCKFFR